MKKIALLFFMTISILACKNNKKTSEDTREQPDFTVHSFKISGLDDSIISDSIWKMLFKFEGIEELVLDKNDSLFVIKIDQSKVSKEEIQKEIALRGGKVLKEQ